MLVYVYMYLRPTGYWKQAVRAQRNAAGSSDCCGKRWMLCSVLAPPCHGKASSPNTEALNSEPLNPKPQSNLELNNARECSPSVNAVFCHGL